MKGLFVVPSVIVIEENSLIQQDLYEILNDFDETLEVEVFPNLETAESRIAELEHVAAAVVNADLQSFCASHLNGVISAKAGRVVWLGSTDDTATPGENWVFVNTPFTTDAVRRALATALEARPIHVTPANTNSDPS